MASKDEREFDSGLTGGTDVPALEEDFSLEEILAEYGAGREQRLMEAVEQEARRETEPAAPPAEGGAKKPPLQTEARPRPAPQVTEKTAPPQKPPAQPEDLLEELVGNIYDEFDPQEEQDIIRLEDNKWRVSGSADLEELAEAMDLDLPEDEERDYDTLGGLVFSQLSVIPEDGSRPVVEAMGLRIRVEELCDRRVEWALVEKLSPAPQESRETKLEVHT